MTFDPRPFCTCALMYKGEPADGDSDEFLMKLDVHGPRCAAWKVATLLAQARREALLESALLVEGAMVEWEGWEASKDAARVLSYRIRKLAGEP